MRRHLFLIVCVLGTATSGVAFAQIPGQSQLGGWVYIDRNNDGVLAFLGDPNPEFVIGDVFISLFAKVGSVETLVATMQSDQFGRYLFPNINPGTYVLRETPPIEFVDGIDTLGVLQSLNGQPIPGSASVGVMSDNMFSDIVLTADVGGDFYNFGERGLTAESASKRFLFGTRPPPPGTPPPPPGDPPSPEPTSLMLALMAGCGSLLTVRRARRR
jgi:SdrD B-like domain